MRTLGWAWYDLPRTANLGPPTYQNYYTWSVMVPYAAGVGSYYGPYQAGVGNPPANVTANAYLLHGPDVIQTVVTMTVPDMGNIYYGTVDYTYPDTLTYLEILGDGVVCMTWGGSLPNMSTAPGNVTAAYY